MVLRAQCTHCSTELQIPEEARGQRMRCSQCGETFVVPTTTDAVQARPTVPPLEPIADALPADDATYCEACGQPAPTAYVVFHQHIGCIVMMFHKHIKGNLCRACIAKYFKEYTLTTLCAGWWGLISFFATPVFLIMNVARYSGVGSLPAGFNRAAAPATLLLNRAPPPHTLKVRLPASFLTAVGVLGILHGLYAVRTNLTSVDTLDADVPVIRPTEEALKAGRQHILIQPGETPQQARERFTRMAYLWSVQTAIALLVVIGGVQMFRLRWYFWAVTTSLLACIPVLGPCCVLGIPFGIWSLIILCQRDVRALFG